MRSKFCVSFIKIILILFDKTKEKSNRNLYYRDQSVQDAFFDLPEQMTGDMDSCEKSGRKLSNDTMNLLDSWLELLELQTNEFTVDHSLLKFLLVGSQAITDPTEYISLTLKKVLNSLTKLWNVDLLRQFRNETFSRFLNVISNVFKSSGYVAKKVQVRCLLFDLDLLAMNIQNAALCLLEQSPSMVCELARLLCTIAQHNASLGIGGFIRALIDVVTKNATSIVNLAQVVPNDDKEKIKLWASNPETTKLANQVHLLAVLSAEMPFACAKEMCSDKKCHLMPKLYSLLELTLREMVVR